jgi:hypothetical protein
VGGWVGGRARAGRRVGAGGWAGAGRRAYSAVLGRVGGLMGGRHVGMARRSWGKGGAVQHRTMWGRDGAPRAGWCTTWQRKPGSGGRLPRHAMRALACPHALCFLRGALCLATSLHALRAHRTDVRPDRSRSPARNQRRGGAVPAIKLAARRPRPSKPARRRRNRCTLTRTPALDGCRPASAPAGQLPSNGNSSCFSLSTGGAE